MCPVTTMLAIATIAGAGSSYMQGQAANAQADATQDAANNAAQSSQSQLERRQFEEGQAVSARSFERTRQANRERGKIRAAAANQGLAGVGASRSLSVSDVNTAIDISRLYTNLDNSNLNAMQSSMSIEGQRQGRVNTAEAGRVSPMMQLVQTGMGALGGLQTGMGLTGSSLGSLFGGSSKSIRMPTGGGGSIRLDAGGAPIPSSFK